MWEGEMNKLPNKTTRALKEESLASARERSVQELDGRISWFSGQTRLLGGQA